MNDIEHVELYATGGGALGVNDYVTIRVRGEVAMLTAGEWARLISRPQRGPAVLEKCSASTPKNLS